MPPIEITPGIYWIGVNDRTTDLFEGLWPISQEGVSYNTYLIDDEKKAIIDLTKAFKTDEFLDQIEQITDVSRLDYIIINHMEPDHSGVLRTLRKLAPHAILLGTEKACALLESFYGITTGVRVVQDGETLTLGAHTLRFIHTPFIHWPETMMTYEMETRTLFSCDAFGGYGALRGAIFDDECTDPTFYEREALRYYANIVAGVSKPVLKAINALAETSISTIAPSHGLIWRRDPQRIISLYRTWAGYATGPAEIGVTLLYGSMYGNTERMMNAVAQGVSSEGVALHIFDVTHTHVSYILPFLWTQRGVIIGAPTYEGALFPPMVQALNMAAVKRIHNRKAAYFGSYGWNGGGRRHLEQLIEPLKWDLVGVVEFAGGPTQEDLRRGQELGACLAQAVKNE